MARSSEGEIISRNLTQKRSATDGDGSVSIMTSLYLSENDLNALKPIHGAVIEKRRYFVETADRRISIDVFKAPFDGLILAEVEFKSEQERDAYSPPDSDWKEVTGNQNYSCGYLAFYPEKYRFM